MSMFLRRASGVVQVAEGYLAGGSGVADGLEVGQGPLPEAVALVEHADLLGALERGLDGDGARSAARAQEGDDLAGDLDAAAAELTGVAHAVGDVAVELAVLIYNGVDAADGPGSGADLVEVGDDRVLERHRHVAAHDVEGAQRATASATWSMSTSKAR